MYYKIKEVRVVDIPNCTQPTEGQIEKMNQDDDAEDK